MIFTNMENNGVEEKMKQFKFKSLLYHLSFLILIIDVTTPGTPGFTPGK